jgi:hypothetical protein
MLDEDRPPDELAAVVSSRRPVLARTWAALDGAEVPWLVLRGDPEAPGGDIDVLVGGDRQRFEAVLADHSFVHVPAIGHGAHRFFRAYDAAGDRWLTIDAIRELAFGPFGALRLEGVAADILAARIRDGDVWRPAAGDAFWLLALHDLLDRREIATEHAAALAMLAPAAGEPGVVRAALISIAGEALASQFAARVAVATAGDADPAAAVAVGDALRRRWIIRQPGAAAYRATREALLGRLRKPYTAVRRPGIGVALLGPDGSGKSSLAASLGEGFPVPVRTVYLGLHGGDLARPGSFGIFRRLRRLWIGWLVGRWHRSRGRVVIYDRHGLDARLPRPRASPRSRLRRWILGHAIPPPQLALVLDAPAAVLHARKGEHDEATLDAQRRGYLSLAGRLRQAQIVDANRPRDDVRRDVVDRIWQRLAAGYRG